MIRASALLFAAAAAVGAEAWDFVPVAAYFGEPIEAALRTDAAPAGWRAQCGDAPAELDAPAPGVLRVRATPEKPTDLVIVAPDGAARALRLVAPGAGSALALDEAGRLACEGRRAVLALARVEAVADRRWSMLASIEEEPVPCSAVLQAPSLLALIVAAQRQPLGSGDVLVVLDGRDRDAGWKPREYRQALAWLVSDLLARGARGVVLAGPFAPRPFAAEIAPLRASVDDVALAYRCRRLPLETLDADRWWTIAPGVLGADLNGDGRAALAEELRSWRAP